MRAIKEWPTQKSITEVRNFHGLASFYRRFVTNFSTLAAPLTEIVKKSVGFKWSNEQDRAFVKKSVGFKCGTPLLGLPDFSKTFEIECDASGIGMYWSCFDVGEAANSLF
jgi:hypothetical protein